MFVHESCDVFACKIIDNHLSQTIHNAPTHSHSEHSIMLCLVRVLRFGFMCCACGLLSSNYGVSCVLGGTD
jgi:hypothetical protein